MGSLLDAALLKLLQRSRKVLSVLSRASRQCTAVLYAHVRGPAFHPMTIVQLRPSLGCSPESLTEQQAFSDFKYEGVRAEHHFRVRL